MLLPLVTITTTSNTSNTISTTTSSATSSRPKSSKTPTSSTSTGNSNRSNNDTSTNNNIVAVTTSSNSNHNSNHHNHQYSINSNIANSSYHPQRFNHHHHNNNMSYAARSSNSQRGQNHNNHQHQHHHHHHHHNSNNNNHHQNQQPNSGETSNIPITTTATLPASEISSAASTAAGQRQLSGPPHYVDLHVNAGECVSLQLLDGQEQVVAGPATITMISQQQNPPVPIPVQVPPGHMIHQIADENGTLKHIILSVMNTDESPQLDSTVITLPQGTFRIDSNGELVSTGTGDSGPLTTLPQQAHFANYDGCTVVYDATALPDSIEISNPIAGQTVSDTANSYTTMANNEDEQSRETEIQVASSKLTSEKNPTTKDHSKGGDVKDEIDSSNSSCVSAPVEIQSQIDSDNTPISDTRALPKDETPSSDAIVTSSEANQIVAPTSISDTSYQAHPAMGNEIEIMNSSMPSMISSVDGQLYSYPPCCCCCYCDPQEAANGVQHPMPVSGQQDVIIGPEHNTSVAAHSATGNQRMSSRGSANNLIHSNGAIMPYSSGPMMGQVQGLSMGVPPPVGPLVQGHDPSIQPIVGQNGASVQSANVAESGKLHGHMGKPTRSGSSGYKQHKMGNAGPLPNGQQVDARQQQGYNNHYQAHNNQSYNKIVAGHHHSHQQQSPLPQPQQHYHHTTDVCPTAPFKPQAMLNNQGSMLAGNYSPAYSNYNHAPTTLAAVVSSNKSVHGGNPVLGLQQQQMAPNYRVSESDNYLHRTREQAGYIHTASNSYGPANSRSQHHENKRGQSLGDKTSSQHNRYPSANVKVIGSSHIINSPSGQSPCSVSPIRARMKPSQQHHQSNGLRSGHFSGAPVQDVKENMMPAHSPGGFYGQSRDSSQAKASKNVYLQDHAIASAAPKHINHPATTSSASYYQALPPPPSQLSQQHQQLGAQKNSAWQTGNKLNHFKSNNSSFEHQNEQKPIAKNQEGTETQVTARHDGRAKYTDGASTDQPHQSDRRLSATERCESSENMNAGNSDTRSSRGKQKKCQNITSASKNQTSVLPPETQRQQIPSDTMKELKSSEGPSNECEDKLTTASDGVKSSMDIRSDSKGRKAKDSPSKQIRGVGASKRVANPDISNQTEKAGETLVAKGQLKTVALKSDDSKGDLNEGTDRRFSINENQQTGAVLTDTSSSSATSTPRHSSDSSHDQRLVGDSQTQTDSQPKHKNDSRHNGNQVTTATSVNLTNSAKYEVSNRQESKKASVPKTNQSSTGKGSFKPKLIVSGQQDRQSGSPSIIDENQFSQTEAVCEGSSPGLVRADSPASSISRRQAALSMRTSLSENNIQSLEAALNKANRSSSHKTSLTNTIAEAQSQLVAGGAQSIDSNGGRKKGDKRRGSNGKNEQQLKLSSVPQLKLLNLNCTSVTSGSVQLRWSYIPSLADKHGIHHHHNSGSKNQTLMDHFIIESSNARNTETGNLVSPKNVYQGCAMTCRVNHLSSEKIYHFRVRRTALLTSTKSEKSTEIGEYMVVSDILSVTLPSAQQQQTSNRKSSNNSSKLGIHHRDPPSTDSNHQSVGLHNQRERGASLSHRGNTSSHGCMGQISSAKSHSQPVQISNLFKQCRAKSATMFGKLVQNSLSSCSDSKFAGLLLVLFTIVAMLLAMFIHIYIVAPVTE